MESLAHTLQLLRQSDNVLGQQIVGCHITGKKNDGNLLLTRSGHRFPYCSVPQIPNYASQKLGMLWLFFKLNFYETLRNAPLSEYQNYAKFSVQNKNKLFLYYYYQHEKCKFLLRFLGFLELVEQNQLGVRTLETPFWSRNQI